MHPSPERPGQARDGFDKTYRARYIWNLPSKRTTARFYQTEAGARPVRDWLVTLSREDCTIVGTDIAKVEFGWPIGMPICRNIRDGVWDVRSTIRNGRVEARTYFAIEGADMILLHGHEGKTQQPRAIKLAADRWRDYQRRMSAQTEQAAKGKQK